MISGSASIVERPVLGAAAVVGDDDGVDAVLDRELGVLAGENTLEHHFHLGRSRSRWT